METLDFEFTPDDVRFIYDGQGELQIANVPPFKFNTNTILNEMAIEALKTPSKELNALIFLALKSDKYNTVIVNSKDFKDAFRFVEVNEIAPIFNNMKKAAMAIILPSLDNKRHRVVFNPVYIKFSNSLFERDHLLFGSLYFSEKKLETPIKSEKQEYVYLMKGFETYTKIGRSTNVKNRVISHACSNPNTELLFCIESDGLTEGRLHKHFKDKRVKLEWFDLSDSDIEWIKSNFKVVE